MIASFLSVVYDIFALYHGNNRNLQHSGLTTCSFVRMEKGCLKSRWVPFFVGKNTVVIRDVVKPVYNGPILSSHPLLTGQFSKSRFFTCINAVLLPLYLLSFN